MPAPNESLQPTGAANPAFRDSTFRRRPRRLNSGVRLLDDFEPAGESVFRSDGKSFRVLAMEEFIPALAVATVVALAVTAVLMIPCCFLLRSRTMKVLTAIGTSLFAVAAVTLGMGMSMWAFYTGPGGVQYGLPQWLDFAAFNAILAAGAGIPGGILGMIIARKVGR